MLMVETVQQTLRGKKTSYVLCWFFLEIPLILQNLFHDTILSFKKQIIFCFLCDLSNLMVCFFQDYHWWWRSFLTSSFTAVYLFIYAVHYFFSKLQITGTASTILYFGYTMIMVLIFFLFTGEYSIQRKMNAGVSLFV